MQHRDIYDEDHGGRYTVKKYHSEKVFSEDGQWRHERVVLKPVTTVFGYKEIVLFCNESVRESITGEYILVV